MPKNSTIKTQDIINYLFWTLILQGLVYLILGIGIFLYPALLFILVSVNFLWLGITTLILAWRIRKFHGVIPELFTDKGAI